MFGVPQKMLDKFWVKKASRPRNSRFTFENDGFFKAVQQKAAVILKEVGTGPTLLSTLTMDSLVVTFVLLFSMLCFNPCWYLLFPTGKFSK